MILQKPIKPPRMPPVRLKRSRPRKQRKTAFAQTKAILDRLVADAVRERDGHVCTLCGVPEQPGRVHDWAHLMSRKYYATRWAWENSTTLCRRCHQKYTRSPEAWVVLMQTKMGMAAWDKLYLKAMCFRGKTALDLWTIAVQAGPQGVKPW